MILGYHKCKYVEDFCPRLKHLLGNRWCGKTKYLFLNLPENIQLLEGNYRRWFNASQLDNNYYSKLFSKRVIKILFIISQRPRCGISFTYKRNILSYLFNVRFSLKEKLRYYLIQIQRKKYRMVLDTIETTFISIIKFNIMFSIDLCVLQTYMIFSTLLKSNLQENWINFSNETGLITLL